MFWVTLLLIVTYNKVEIQINNSSNKYTLQRPYRLNFFSHCFVTVSFSWNSVHFSSWL